MGGYLRDLKALLEAAGCHYHRPGKGDHEIWYSPVKKRYFTVDHGLKSRHTATRP